MEPELSVVIPTFRRPAKLARALDRLDRQRRDGITFELVVVANPGQEQSEVDRAVGNRAVPTRLLGAEVAGASAARNVGWRAARGRIVLFLGDDILASRRLLLEHWSWHRKNPADEVGVLGRVRWARGIRVTPFMRWLERGMQFDYGGIEGTEAGPGRLYTANVSLKREMLERVGGFDEELPFLYEDIELGYRLSALGFRLLYNRRARAEHLHEVSLESWQARMRIAAAAERRLVAKHPEIEPRTFELMQRANSAPPARGRAAALVAVVPPWVPWLGRKVWKSAETRWLQALAPDFLAAWEEAGSER